jgi:hypothetical protein
MSLHSFRLEHNGVKYGAMAQGDSRGVYRVEHIWDQTHQQYLPIFEIEREYVRLRGSLEATIMRSRWAARRRAKQYILLWAELQKTEGE